MFRGADKAIYKIYVNLISWYVYIYHSQVVQLNTNYYDNAPFGDLGYGFALAVRIYWL